MASFLCGFVSTDVVPENHPQRKAFLLVVAVLVFVNLVKNKIKLTLKQCGALGLQPHCAAENQCIAFEFPET